MDSKVPDSLRLYSKAAKLSLENAEQWLKDAKLLLEHGSFGHADALIRLAVEEAVKALVCWLTSERIWPIENKVVRDVFRHHKVKNEFFLSFLAGWTARARFPSWKRLMESASKLLPEQISDAPKEFQKMIASTDKMRHRAMYVDRKGKEVETPIEVKEEEAKNISRLAEFFLKTVRHTIEEFPEEKKAELRGFFSKIPEESWETGEVSATWLQRAIREAYQTS